MTNNSKITIVDIAQAANVSPSTVSRVLRGTTAVSEEKHQAVMAAVKALNYRPNIFAQSLASGQSMTIGVLTQNFGSPFYDGILQGILLGLEHTSYSPVFADGRWDLEVEKRALQTLIDRQIDALIIVGGRIPEATIQEVANQMPLIVIARRIKSLPNYCLHVDNFEAAYKATQYLLNKGHRHIAHIAGAINDLQVDDVYQRYEGYNQALIDAGITPIPELVISGTLQQHSGVIAIEGLLARGRPFSAIFAANDQMAFGARLALFRRGIRVPEEISLIGFDDEGSAAYMIPPLTTVRQPALELGEAAAATIIDMLKGNAPREQIFKAELIFRESVARR